jgi:Gamma-glutamyl cyclotransferase, AIG2-like
MLGLAPRRQYVFGYGSLLELRDRGPGWPAARFAELTDHRRLWNVAMDNAVDLPGYKHYVSPLTGLRPAVFVTFLNIVPAPGCRVNGTLIEVSEVDLVSLDARERNYARVDVTAAVDDPPDGTVWSYVGTPAGLARFAAGQSADRAVVVSDYLDHVRSGFAALAADGLREFDRLTSPPPCPVVDLRRVDV